MDALSVESDGSNFCFGALGGDFFAIPHKIDAGGVAGFYYDFEGGSHRGVGRGDEGFLSDFLAVGADRYPGIFRSPDGQDERRCG